MRLLLLATLSLLFLNSCSTTPNYSSYPEYFREKPDSSKTDIDPGTTLNCFFEGGGIAQYYFGLSGDRTVVIRYFDISTSPDRNVVMQNVNEIKHSSEQTVVLWEVEQFGSFTNQCPYTFKNTNELVTNHLRETTTTINRNTLKFMQINKKIFVDQTNAENPVCRVRSTSTSNGYCRLERGSIPFYREWIDSMMNPQKQF